MPETDVTDALVHRNLTVLDQLTLDTDGFIELDEHSSAPGTPGSGSVRLYAKADGYLYGKDDAGNEYDLTGGGGTLAIANGGTGQTSKTPAFDALAPTTTKGDLIAHDGSDNLREAIGSNGHILTADSAQASGMKWAAAAGGGDMSTATYDAATIAEQLVGLTAGQTLTNKSIDADGNTLANVGLAELDADTAAMMDLFVGTFLDSPAITVASDGSTITCTVEKSGTGDIRVVFSTGVEVWDCTPADTVVLTAGTDISPTLNYVYFLKSNSTLTRSTSGWPAAEHAPVATVLCQSAASLQTDGSFKVHAWRDHTISTQGHLGHLNHWMRLQHASWQSGVVVTSPSIGANVFNIVTSSGIVHQLHEHTMPALTTVGPTDPLWVVNDNSTAYKRVNNLTAEVTDSIGGSLAGKKYNIVVWAAISEVAADCKIFINLPNGSYNTAAKAIADDAKTANYNIPMAFKGTGFLLARLSISNSGGSGGTFTLDQNEDLRGQLPSTFAGGTAAAQTEFVDTNFRILDDGDVTKEIALQASGISSGNTRTITMADNDVLLAGAAPAELAAVQAAAVGTSTSIARADHAHQIQHAITDNHLVTIDDADAADNDYAKFTAFGLEGRSYAELISDINSAASGSIAVARGGTNRTAAPTHPLLLHAAGGMGTATSGGGDANNLPEQAETSGQKVNYHYLAMATGESVFWNILMPLNWNAGTLTAIPIWTAASGSDDVKFEVKGGSFANSDALDTALGAAGSVEDTLITAEDVHISGATGAITLAGTPAAGEYVVIEVKRVAPGGVDLGVDVRLLGVRLLYTANGYSEN